jgi:hypothetical protein
LQSDFEERDLIVQLLNKLERIPFCWNIESDDDLVSGPAHSKVLCVMSRAVETSQYW